MKKALAAAAVVMAMLLTACTADSTATVDTASVETATEESTEVSIINNDAEEFHSFMQGEYLLLDVRTQEEYDAGHIEGSTLIPVTELASRLDEIADYRDKTVLVYCRSGNRSVTASNILIENGFTQVHNLLGGIGAWNEYKGN